VDTRRTELGELSNVSDIYKCFQKYLYSRARAQHPLYLHCLADIDDVEHNIFVCPFWAEERVELVQSLGIHSLPSGAQDLLCGSPIDQLPTDNVRRRILETASVLSKLYTKMVEGIMVKKQALERERQRNERQ